MLIGYGFSEKMSFYILDLYTKGPTNQVVAIHLAIKAYVMDAWWHSRPTDLI